MYLHTGNNHIVFHRELIGIFNHRLHHNPNKGQEVLPFADRAENEFADQKKYKSIIVTDRGTYTSPISPLTLAGRNLKRNFFPD